MTLTWRIFWKEKRKWLRTGWLIAAGLVAVYAGFVLPSDRAQQLRNQRETGLGAVAGSEPASLWRSGPLTLRAGPPTASVDRAAVVARMASADTESNLQAPAPPPPPPQAGEDRKMVRTGTIDLVVGNPAQAAERIRQMADRMGGFLESSQVSGDQDAPSAQVVVRIPVARFEEARNEIRKLGLRVENDRLEAQDVTRDYVDREARLHSLRAQEQQYLAILKRATTVKDTLEVVSNLDQVRGQIEQQQAEFEALSKQVETVALTVSLSAEVDTQVFGLHWRPLYRLKMAARDGLDGLGNYAATLTAFAFYLPVILLWLGTLLVGSAIAWKILRWAARRLFGYGKAVPAGGAPA